MRLASILPVVFCIPLAPSVLWAQSQTTSNQSATTAAPIKGQLAPASKKPFYSPIMVAVTPQGFEPSEATVPAGTVRLTVLNRAALRSLNLQLDRVSTGPNAALPSRVAEKLSRVDTSRSTFEQVLTAGDYILTEANNPSWRCLIQVIQNNQ